MIWNRYKAKDKDQVFVIFSEHKKGDKVADWKSNKELIKVHEL
jgi:hypothetical protein